RVTFYASGVSDKILATASTEASSIKGVAVAVGLSIFGKDWQQLGAIRWLWTGRGDYVTLQQQSGDQGIQRAIEFSVGSRFTTRRRRGLSYLTDRDQQERHPGDKFCERTVLYSSEVSKVWPTFS